MHVCFYALRVHVRIILSTSIYKCIEFDGERYIYIHTNAHVYVNGSVPMRMWKKKHASRVIRLLMQMRGQKYSRSILRIYWYGVAIPLPTPLFEYIHVRTLVVCCFKTILYLDASS